MENLWSDLKKALKQRLASHTFRMWIEPIVFEKCEEGVLTLSCPNQFSKRRVVEQYSRLIEAELQLLTGTVHGLKVTTLSRDKKRKEMPSLNQQLQLPNIQVQPHSGRFLKKDYTFDQFVVGGNNDFAYTAALSLAAKKKSDQNTLFLLSKTGLGKSHLSQAVGHHILSEFPTERVYYVTAEDFTNEMVDSFRNNMVGRFKKKYQDQCDVLLMEDIHYLSGKQRTQVELAQTIDTLFNSGKKVIFSSCYLPTDIPRLDDQLRSRLSSGLISNIDPPDYRTRIRILRKKAANRSFRITDDVLNYLAGELTEDVRQLNSGLMGVISKSSLLGVPVDVKLAESVVKCMIHQKKTITIDVIKKIVCKHFNVTLKDLISKSRKQAIVRPRQVAIFLSRKYTDQPLQSIGKCFNRYHATALHAIGTVEKGIKKNPVIQQQVDFLSRKIESCDF